MNEEFKIDEIEKERFSPSFGKPKTQVSFAGMDSDIVEWVDSRVPGNNRGQRWEYIYNSWRTMIDPNNKEK